jgi:hypothetical protein
METWTKPNTRTKHGRQRKSGRHASHAAVAADEDSKQHSKVKHARRRSS